MNRGRIVDTLWLVLVLACVGVIGYGIWPKSHHSAAPPSSTVTKSGVHLIPPATVTDTTVNRYPLAPHDVGVCTVVGIPYRDILKPHRLTFTDVVTRPLGSGELNGAAAGVSLLFGHYSGDPGPYGPAIAYTMAKYAAPQIHVRVPPVGDAKVLSSAVKLDRFLRAGGCP